MCSAVLQTFSIHAWWLIHLLQCPKSGNEEEKAGKGTNYLSKRAIIIIREAAGLLPTRLISSPARQEGNQAPSISEMFIYATGMPKDAEKALLQVMTAKPRRITHFLSFNLPFSMGTLFEAHTLL